MSASKPKTNIKVWIVGIGALLLSIIATLPMTVLSVFVVPISEGTGSSIGSVSLIFSLISIGSLITSLLLGTLIKHLHPKILVIIGGILIGVLLVAIGLVRNIIVLYIAAILFGAGTVIGGLTFAQVVISQWFLKGRGTMMSICMVGITLSAAIFNPLFATQIEGIGYGPVAAIYGLITGVIIVLIGLLAIQGAPEKSGLKPYGYEEPVTSAEGAGETEKPAALVLGGLTAVQARRTPYFWAIVSVMLIGSMASMAFSSQASNYFQSLGLNAVNASYCIAIFNLVAMVYTLAFGILADKKSPSFGVLITGIVTAVGYLLIIFWQGWAGAIASSVLMSAIAGMSGLFGATAMTRLFGTREAGALIGFCTAAGGVGAFIGPLLAGMLFDAFGNYVACFLIMGVFILLGVLLAVWVGTKKATERVKQIENEGLAESAA
jgi:MFS family permease